MVCCEGTGADIGAMLRELAVSDEARGNEMVQILYGLSFNPDQQQATWDWVSKEMEAILARIPTWRQGAIVTTHAGACSAEHAEKVRAEFEKIIEGLEGGRRYMAQTLEGIEVCAELKRIKGGEIDRYFQDPPDPDEEPQT